MTKCPLCVHASASGEDGVKQRGFSLLLCFSIHAEDSPTIARCRRLQLAKTELGRMQTFKKVGGSGPSKGLRSAVKLEANSNELRTSGVN